MSLVADLQALDLSAIVRARGTITGTADGDELKAVLTGDVSVTAMGDFGEVLAKIRADVEDPGKLFNEVLEDFSKILAGVPGVGGLDVAGWEAAVREGAGLVAELVAALGGDLSKVGEAISGAGGDLARDARLAMGDYARVGIDELAQMRRLVDAVASGVPIGAEAFARLTLDLLFPGSASDVLRLRSSARILLEGSAAIALPEGRVAGLLDAHAAVAAAAQTGGDDELRAALAMLSRARATR